MRRGAATRHETFYKSRTSGQADCVLARKAVWTFGRRPRRAGAMWVGTRRACCAVPQRGNANAVGCRLQERNAEQNAAFMRCGAATRHDTFYKSEALIEAEPDGTAGP